ncbi:unnamed protein product, partial [Staurois parvus]
SRGIFTTRQTRHLPRVAFFRRQHLPQKKDGRRDMHAVGTRWDPREAAGCLMVYTEPDSHSQGCLEL